MVLIGDADAALDKALDDDQVIVLTMCGQSNIFGTNSFESTKRTEPQYGRPDNASPMPRAFMWDKQKRINFNDKTLVDVNRSNESHSWRPLTVGWGAGGAAYPWEALPDDPSIGAELQISHRIIMATQRPVYIIKVAEGGTNLFNSGVIGDHRWNINTTGDDSLFEVWRDAYWGPAMTDLVDNVLGGDASRAVFAGMVWFQGAADMNNESWANAYETNLSELMDVSGTHPDGFRKVINPSDPDDVPTLIVRSEPYYDSDGTASLHDYVTTVRTAQETVQALIPNSALVSCDECAREDDGTYGTGEGEHLIFDGQNCLGNTLAAGSLGLTWLEGPSY